MNTFKQHIPNFVDLDEEPPTYNFNTTEELLELEVVKRYGRSKDFSYFAMSEEYLMEISDNGFKWWVVGRIKYPESVDLPQWNGGKYRAEFPNGEKRIVLGDTGKWWRHVNFKQRHNNKRTKTPIVLE